MKIFKKGYQSREVGLDYLYVSYCPVLLSGHAVDRQYENVEVLIGGIMV